MFTFNKTSPLTLSSAALLGRLMPSTYVYNTELKRGGGQYAHTVGTYEKIPQGGKFNYTHIHLTSRTIICLPKLRVVPIKGIVNVKYKGNGDSGEIM